MGIIASKGGSSSVTFTNPQEIVISHTDDSIKIGDGIDLLAVNSDGSINANVAVDHTQDSMKVGDGTNFLAVNADGSINTAVATYTTRLDEPSATITYVGKAVAGTSAGAASWQISRLTVSGTELIMEYADGDMLYNNIWNNRASLSYS
jgi:hypothetical protein